MAKFVWQLMKMKPHLVNSNSFQKQHTNSFSFFGSGSGSCRDNGILLKRRITKDCGSEENILSFLVPNPNPDVGVENIDLPHHYFKHPKYLGIKGHSHGIICLSDVGDNCKDIILYNPATRVFRQLPPTILDITIYHSIESVRFGYDPKSKDFKVVRVFNLVERDDLVSDKQIEVYNLSTGEWREIITPVPLFPMWQPLVGNLYHDGVFYQFNNEIILAFDLTTEVFREIPLPNISFKDLRKFKSLIDFWNGSFVLLLSFDRDKDFNFYEIWATDDLHSQSDGVSWSKVFTIGHLPWFMKPLLFVNSDEIILEAMHGQVISYHLKTKEFKNLVKGVPFKSEGVLFQKSKRNQPF